MTAEFYPSQKDYIDKLNAMFTNLGTKVGMDSAIGILPVGENVPPGPTSSLAQAIANLIEMAQAGGEGGGTTISPYLADLNFTNSTTRNIVDSSGRMNDVYVFGGTNPLSVSGMACNGSSVGATFEHLIGKYAFTVAIKFSTTQVAAGGAYYTDPCLFGLEMSGAGRPDFGITVKNGYVGYWGGIFSASEYAYVSSTFVSDNTTHVVALTFDSETSKLYCDGVLLHTHVGGIGAPVSSNSSSYPALIGGVWSGWANCNFDGLIKRVVVSNRALSELEVQQIV